MARIAGVNIPDRKHTVIALTSIYGIGRSRAAEICNAVGIDPSVKVRDLAEPQVEALRGVIGKYVVVKADTGTGIGHR